MMKRLYTLILLFSFLFISNKSFSQDLEEETIIEVRNVLNAEFSE